MSLPFDPKRSQLYTVAELLLDVVEEGNKTRDFMISDYYVRTNRDRADDFQVLKDRNEHDSHVLINARRYITGKRVIAFMGGHSLLRDSPGYASCARIARALSRKGFLIMTGGGPGAMEAAMLGVYLAEEHDSALDVALVELRTAPSHLDRNWLAAALRVTTRYPRSEAAKQRYPSLGVSTWLYSSEPSNIFSTYLAKLFSNGVREDFLTNEAREAVVFFPGSLGTMQEMFMVAALVHYKFTPCTLHMYDEDGFWDRTIPVMPLLRQLALKGGWSGNLQMHLREKDVIEAITNEAPQASL